MLYTIGLVVTSKSGFQRNSSCVKLKGLIFGSSSPIIIIFIFFGLNIITILIYEIISVFSFKIWMRKIS